jgi:hypothetical protein
MSTLGLSLQRFVETLPATTDAQLLDMHWAAGKTDSLTETEKYNSSLAYSLLLVREKKLDQETTLKSMKTEGLSLICPGVPPL